MFSFKMIKNVFLGISIGATLGTFSLADENGKLVYGEKSCGLSVFSALDFICDAFPVGGVTCDKTADKCGSGSQEVFTGLAIELASPGNWNNWTGFGGMGELYTGAALCLLRDLKAKPIVSEAHASVALGKVSIKQKIQFAGFDPKARSVEAYQRSQACAPVIGCINILDQKLTFVARSTDMKTSGQKVGNYLIHSSNSLDIYAEALAQGLNVTLPAITVNTPYGTVDAKPTFGFGRAAGFVLSPFDGNVFSKIDNPMGAANVGDLYGRNPGVKASQVFPHYLNFSDRTVDNRHIGWRSQMGIGSRDPNPKTSVWKPTAGVEFPYRPDMDMTQARSTAEKTPNAYLGANVKVTYDPTGVLPDWIKNSGFINIAFQVFAKPTIDLGFTNQLNVLSSEFSKWDAVVQGDYRPNHLDQYKELTAFAGSSAAARFALESGVDLTLKLHIPIPGPFPDIKKTLVDIHPRATLAEAISVGHGTSKEKIVAKSQATKVVATGKYFQNYTTLLGDADATAHLTACSKAPKETAPAPEAPKYTPGNPEELTEKILYPCNICVGMNDETWKDQFGKEHVIKGFLQTYFPSTENNRPEVSKWKCDHVIENGCYDMCSWDPATKKLSVVKTAIEMLASGELTGAYRCR